MVTGEATQGRGGPVTGHSTFPDAGDGGSVVTKVFQGGVRERSQGAHGVNLREESGVFQVAVRNVPSRSVRGYESPLDICGKRVSPNMGRPGRIVEDPAHAGLGSIGGAQHGGFLRDDFGDASGAVTQASSESSEGVEAVTHKPVNSHTVQSGFVLCPLQGAE